MMLFLLAAATAPDWIAGKWALVKTPLWRTAAEACTDGEAYWFLRDGKYADRFEGGDSSSQGSWSLSGQRLTIRSRSDGSRPLETTIANVGQLSDGLLTLQFRPGPLKVLTRCPSGK
jgi:hypothetical protein